MLLPSRQLLSLSLAQISMAMDCLANNSYPPEELADLSLEDWMQVGDWLDSLIQEMSESKIH